MSTPTCARHGGGYGLAHSAAGIVSLEDILNTPTCALALRTSCRPAMSSMLRRLQFVFVMDYLFHACLQTQLQAVWRYVAHHDVNTTSLRHPDFTPRHVLDLKDSQLWGILLELPPFFAYCGASAFRCFDIVATSGHKRHLRIMLAAYSNLH